MMGGATHEACILAVKDTAALLNDLGHEVVETGPELSHPAEHYVELFNVLWFSSCVATIDAIGAIGGFAPEAGFFESLTWAFYEKGREHSAARYLSALEALQRASREICRFFENYDVLLTPVLAEPPVDLGTFDAPENNPMAAWDRVVQFAPFTALFNATGQPAMSVPLYWTADGLPVGSHFVGRFGDEATLFRLASQLEAARPWADRRPMISAC
jgi:amidase